MMCADAMCYVVCVDVLASVVCADVAMCRCAKKPLATTTFLGSVPGVSSPENVKRGEMRKRGPTARPQVSALSHQGRDLLVPYR